MKVITLTILALFLLSSEVICAKELVSINAEVVTGWNRFLGQVRYQWDFLETPLNEAGASTVGVFNPDGDEALPLTSATPNDAILATIADPFLNVVFPGALDAFPPNPDGLNVPLREVGTWTSGLINHLNGDPLTPAGPSAT